MWRTEFSADYEVPAVIESIACAVDRSWHNDMCPSFGCADDPDDIRLWVEHPDADKREHSGPRYVVSGRTDDFHPILETDSLDEACAEFRNVIATVDVRRVAAWVQSEREREAQSRREGELGMAWSAGGETLNAVRAYLESAGLRVSLVEDTRLSPGCIDRARLLLAVLATRAGYGEKS